MMGLRDRFEPPPRMTGRETAAMRVRLVQEARLWRQKWLVRMYGAWLVGGAVCFLSSLVIDPVYGWATFVWMTFAAGAVDGWIRVRLFPLIGSKSEQTFGKVMALVSAVLGILLPLMIMASTF